jgi:hypothetical protein
VYLSACVSCHLAADDGGRSGAWNSALLFSPAPTTGGGLAFVGDYDRRFRAHDVQSGEALWETRLGRSVEGFPIRL